MAASGQAMTARRAGQDGLRTAALPAVVSRSIAAAVLGGIAGALFGAVMPADELMPMVAALYGVDGVTAGWAIHLVHSMIFGVALLPIATVLGADTDAGFGALVGAVYGVVLWVVAASFVMPVWIGAVTEMEPAVPDWNWLSLVGHVAYGASLGVLLPAIAPRRN